MREPQLVDVFACDDFSLLLTYGNGEHRVYDMTPMLDYDYFAPLRNISFFKDKACIQYGTIAWSDDIDIAPEELYRNSVLYHSTQI